MTNRMDDFDARSTSDTRNMTSLIEGLPEQCESAWRIGEEAELPSWPKPANILVLGMGGSAIGGELLRAYAADQLAVPVTVNRDYHVPAYVNDGTLVIASSYSGNTEETLSAYHEAKARGAKVLAITTGGQLAELAVADGFPVIRIPPGLSPRAALGYSFFPMLVAFQKLGLLPDQHQAFTEAVSVMRSQRDRLNVRVATPENPAKQLALQIQPGIPVVYGVVGWSAVVAYRWKGQINENGKHPAAWHEFPELDHNEIVGWEEAPNAAKSSWIVMLRRPSESPKMRRRIEVTAELIKPKVAGVTFVTAEGESPLAQMFSLIFFGDMVSLYLAFAKNVDPTPVRSIDHLKSELAKLDEGK